MAGDKLRILTIESRYESDVADALLRGAVDALDAFGAAHEVLSVPGVLELPLALAMIEESTHRPTGAERYDGYVLLGSVFPADTLQADLVAREALRGLQDVAIARNLAIGSGILACENEAEALELARPSGGDAGGAAARACLDLAALRRRLLGAAR
ncbi:MAG: 6,7-dimethyl-8-ribityllumazine synthase [Caulobacterales bacterium 68-7]|nr:MAG: 6,7-dimethyl-8-ribityllumazine synthase [Caulobacterales bacterium 68-7]